MDHYIDVRLRPDPEFTPNMLMSALMSKLHRFLAAERIADLGVSFPESVSTKPKGLGNKLRLHGTQQRLSQIHDSRWLTGMTDHVECSSVQVVPSDSKYRVVRRRQFKSNVERLRRRRMKRKGESYEQAVEAIPATTEQRTRLPYATIRSQSTGEVFKLFVDQEPVQAQVVEGEFNSYGLSNGATVPWF